MQPFVYTDLVTMPTRHGKAKVNFLDVLSNKDKV